MKAVLFSEEGKSNIVELETPKIDDDEILLKINTCAIRNISIITKIIFSYLLFYII